MDEDCIRVSHVANGFVTMRQQLVRQRLLGMFSAQNGYGVRLPRKCLHYAGFVALAVERHEIDRPRSLVLSEQTREGHSPHGCCARAVLCEPAEDSVRVSEARTKRTFMAKLEECLPFIARHGCGNYLAAAQLHQAHVILRVRLDADPFPAILLLQGVRVGEDNRVIGSQVDKVSASLEPVNRGSNAVCDRGPSRLEMRGGDDGVKGLLTLQLLAVPSTTHNWRCLRQRKLDAAKLSLRLLRGRHVYVNEEQRHRGGWARHAQGEGGGLAQRAREGLLVSAGVTQ